MNSNWTLTFILVLAALLTSVQAAGEGELCNTDTDCDLVNHLECNDIEGKCRCIDYPTSSYWEPRDLQCHRRRGEKCDANQMVCPLNAECMTTNPFICRCSTSYDNTPAKKCFKKSEKVCTPGTFDCDEGSFLFCLPAADGQNKCNCQSDSTYDSATTAMKCLLKIGESCEGTAQECSKFTECKEDIDTSRRCFCMDGSYENAEGSCTTSNGNSCGTDRPPCDKDNWFECRTNLCQCPTSSELDSKNQTCYLKAKRPCMQGATAQPCNLEKFFICRNALPQFICDCDIDNGAVLDTLTQTCVLNNGSSCVKGPEYQQCNPNKWLTCVDGTCQCDVDSVLDPDTQICRLNYGEPCESGKQPCDASQFHECFEDTCNCGEKAHLDPVEQICVLGYGADCNGNSLVDQYCDSKLFLSCSSERKCDCDQNAHWNNHTCYLNYEARCDPDQQGPDNIICDPLSFFACNSTGFCNCAEGFIYDPVGQQCSLNYQDNCQNNEKCDSSKFLDCYDDICKCRPEADFDVVADSCILNNGKPCQVNDGERCNATKFLTCTISNNICECASDSVMNPVDDICVLKYNSACGQTSQLCDPSFYLSCGGQVCDCGESAEWDTNDSKCYLNYNSICDPNGQLCDEKKLLTCSASNRCSCKDIDEMVYDDFAKKCVVQAQGLCSNDADCVEMSLCIGGRCQCQDGFVISSGKCVRSYGDDCSLDGSDYCDKAEYLTCDDITGRCDCHDRAYMEYVPELNSCYMKIGGNCDNSNPDATPCKPPRLVCDSATSKCICDPQSGYIGDDGTDCVKGFGSICHEIGGSLNDTCDFDLHSICLDNFECGCQEGYTIVIGNLPRCAGTLEAKCENDLECLSSRSMGCDDVTKKCSCYRGQEYNTDDGYCYSILGGECNLTSVSDPEPTKLCQVGLKCENIDDDSLKIGQCAGGGRINFGKEFSWLLIGIWSLIMFRN